MSNKNRYSLKTHFCVSCGIKLETEQIICPKCRRPVKKISTKYLITDDQLKIVKRRVLPCFFIAFLVWLINFLFFSGFITDSPIVLGTEIYFFLTILIIPIYSVLYFTSRNGRIKSGLVLLLVFSALLGILSSFLLNWTTSEVNIRLIKTNGLVFALLFGFFSTSIGFMRGKFGRIPVKFYNKIDLFLHSLYFGYGIILLFLLTIFHVLFLSIFLFFSIFILTAIVVTNNHALIATHLKEDTWVFWSFNTFIVLIGIINLMFYVFYLSVL